MPVYRAATLPDELPLLRTVTADLSDPVALSVYCDFLDDHGDPRGTFLREFLRAFDAREPLPAFPDWASPAWIDVLALWPRRRLREGILDARHIVHPAHQRRYAKLLPVAERFFPEILRNVVPSLRLSVGSKLAEAELPVGTTRAAGRPDLPEGTSWPRSPDSEIPSRFLLQINLADLKATFVEGILPGAGLLSFFDGGHVLYTPPGTPLRRVTAPVAANTSSPLALALADAAYFGRPPKGFDHEAFESLVYRNSTRHDWLIIGRDPGNGEGWGVLDSPKDFVKLASLSSGNEYDEPKWFFGNGGSLHLFAHADAARVGDFSDVQAVVIDDS